MKLKEILENSNLTLTEVSQKTGIKYNTLLCYKNEKRKLTIKSAKILGEFLEVDWWKFFDNEITKQI